MKEKKTKSLIRTKKKPVEEKDKKYTLKELKECMKESWKDFVHEYICNGWNATAAYSKAYPNATRETSGINGHMLLKKTKVQQYIEYMRTNTEDLCGISKQKQLRHYMLMAYNSIAALHDDWITRKQWDDIIKENPEMMTIIEGIEYQTKQALNEFKEPVEIEYVKLKLPSRQSAMASIDRLQGYNATEQINVTFEQPLFPSENV